jgi:hypothetical protein
MMLSLVAVQNVELEVSTADLVETTFNISYKKDYLLIQLNRLSMTEHQQLEDDRDLISTRRSALKIAAGAVTVSALGTSPVTAQAIDDGDTSVPIGEVGVTNFEQPDRGTFFTEELRRTYDDPVVIMKPVGPAGSHPAHIRIQNVSSDSFEYQLEEWSDKDGPHTEVRVSYVVFESGQYILDGNNVLAGTTTATDSFTTVSLDTAFDNPVLLTQSQTRNDSEYIVTRNQIRTGSGVGEFDVRVQEEEGAGGTHAAETIGYVVIEQGEGSVGDTSFEVGRTAPTVTDSPEAVSFGESFDSQPLFIGDLQTFNGKDTAQLR